MPSYTVSYIMISNEAQAPCEVPVDSLTPHDALVKFFNKHFSEPNTFGLVNSGREFYVNSDGEMYFTEREEHDYDDNGFFTEPEKACVHFTVRETPRKIELKPDDQSHLPQNERTVTVTVRALDALWIANNAIVALGTAGGDALFMHHIKETADILASAAKNGIKG